MKKIVIILAFMLAGVISGLSIAFVIDIASLSHTDARQEQQIRQLQVQEHQLSVTVEQLGNTVSGLSTPTDPLSAYSDICNVQLTNSSTDLEQTYYYPCTNNAETIPQPGS